MNKMLWGLSVALFLSVGKAMAQQVDFIDNETSFLSEPYSMCNELILRYNNCLGDIRIRKGLFSDSIRYYPTLFSVENVNLVTEKDKVDLSVLAPKLLDEIAFAYSRILDSDVFDDKMIMTYIIHIVKEKEDIFYLGWHRLEKGIDSYFFTKQPKKGWPRLYIQELFVVNVKDEKLRSIAFLSSYSRYESEMYLYTDRKNGIYITQDISISSFRRGREENGQVIYEEEVTTNKDYVKFKIDKEGYIYLIPENVRSRGYE